LLAGLSGATGVALGAFGAHALKSRLAEAGTSHLWETGVVYQLLHAVALLALAVRAEQPLRRGTSATAWCWFGGTVAFSGSLYALALGGPHWIGPVTPLGGLAFIAGWVVVACSGGGNPAGNA
jgi:uncharacterized membrane protein YgdD (TMEM256/DUF423 family)